MTRNALETGDPRACLHSSRSVPGGAMPSGMWNSSTLTTRRRRHYCPDIWLRKRRYRETE